MTESAAASVARFESLATSLKEAHLASTMKRWYSDDDAAGQLPGLVTARVLTMRSELVIARAASADAGRLIALLRTFPLAYVAAIENVLAALRASPSGELTADDADRAMDGAFHDQTSLWSWGGWDPATGQVFAKPAQGGFRDEWTSPATVGSIARGTRHVITPRTYLMTVAPVEWTRVSTAEGAPASPIVEGPGGEFIARFSRWQDAELVRLAHAAALIAGAVYVDLCALIDNVDGGTLTTDQVGDVVAGSAPWAPGDAETPPFASRSGDRQR